MHADAYRLNSPAEVDDLDLDASLETSVTVVEWGGGLVEGLAPDRLDVSIALAAPGPGPGGVPGGAGPANETSPDDGPGPDDGPARITGPGRIRNRGRYGWRATAPGGKASMASRLPEARPPPVARRPAVYPPEERPPGSRPPVAARSADPSAFLYRFW